MKLTSSADRPAIAHALPIARDNPVPARSGAVICTASVVFPHPKISVSPPPPSALSMTQPAASPNVSPHLLASNGRAGPSHSDSNPEKPEYTNSDTASQ